MNAARTPTESEARGAKPRVPEDQCDRRRREELDHRKEQGVECDRTEVGAEVLAIHDTERRCTGWLAVEELDDADAGKLFLQVRVEPRNRRADVAERLTHRTPEEGHHSRHERQHRECHQREAPVGEQHHCADRDQRRDVADHGHHARREEFVQGLDVGCHARHEAPDRLAVEVRDAETLEVGEELSPEIGHDPLAHPGGQHGLPIFAEETQQEGSGVNRAEGCQHGAVVSRQGHVQRPSREGRRHQRESGLHQEEQHGGGKGRRVWPRVAQQTAAHLRIAPRLRVIGRDRACHGSGTSIALSPRRTHTENTTNPVTMVNQVSTKRHTSV